MCNSVNLYFPVLHINWLLELFTKLCVCVVCVSGIIKGITPNTFRQKYIFNCRFSCQKSVPYLPSSPGSSFFSRSKVFLGSEFLFCHAVIPHLVRTQPLGNYFKFPFTNVVILYLFVVKHIISLSLSLSLSLSFAQSMLLSIAKDQTPSMQCVLDGEEKVTCSWEVMKEKAQFITYHVECQHKHQNTM